MNDTLPSSMRVAVLYDVDDIRIEERPLPDLKSGELLVQTRASGICSGDVMGWYIRRKAPLVLGHEPAGVVAAVGSGSPPLDYTGRAFAVGDRVFCHHHAPCFECAFCLRGDYVQCLRWRSTQLDPGGLAEFFRVPHANVGDTLRLPDTLTFQDAALTEPLACVVKSLRRAEVRSSENVYVIGLGAMGLMHVILAQWKGARVFASDFQKHRRELGRKMGAQVLEPSAGSGQLRDATQGRGADIVICGPGTPAALHAALADVCAGGRVVMFTPLDPAQRFAFDMNDFYFRDIRLIASYSCGPDDTREALDILSAGVVTAEKLGTTEFSLAETPTAYKALVQGNVIKPLIIFERPKSAMSSHTASTPRTHLRDRLRR
ncbi:MAG: alcohol dehydrogenase catalytic domain-containing protein [Candidatus Eremiobacteraeota bacterium]|nr:alcohol dehydrogenase catalytic domain-containing protein [Candidatus Eremiobacteraeota bacterium]